MTVSTPLVEIVRGVLTTAMSQLTAMVSKYSQ